MLVFLVSLALFLLMAATLGAVTLLKGRKEEFERGFFFTPIWVSAALRLAEPDSWWARHFYDDLQMESTGPL